MKIIFTNTFPERDIEMPKPASEHLPEWYKQMDSYKDKKRKPNGSGGPTQTVKKCIPVFDAITSGYIITTPVDIYVSLNNGMQFFQWADMNAVSFNSLVEAPTHPLKKPFDYPKFLSPWGIKTPKGYSCLFTQPMHRESVFTILSGIVDTDQFTAPVNFPFVINDPNFEGLIPKGTPMAQVIPFKRDSWRSMLGSYKDLDALDRVIHKIGSMFFDKYKTMFWTRKVYK
jgi:hypothetical protein